METAEDFEEEDLIKGNKALNQKIKYYRRNEGQTQATVSEPVPIPWATVRLLNINDGWHAFGKACLLVAKESGFRPQNAKKASPLSQPIKIVGEATRMAKASPGAFTRLVADAGGIPVLWATGRSARKEMHQMISAILASKPAKPTSENRKIFRLAVEATATIAREAEGDPATMSREMGNQAVGFPLFLSIPYKGDVPPIPAIIKRLSAQPERHRFDLYRSRRKGTPDLLGANRIAACFDWTAAFLYGARKLLRWDNPDQETLKMRLEAVKKSPMVPEIPQLNYFILFPVKDLPVPQYMTPPETVRTVWGLLEIECVHPERIPELRQLAGHVDADENEKNVATRIRKELSRRLRALKMDGAR